MMGKGISEKRKEKRKYTPQGIISWKQRKIKLQGMAT